MAEKLCHAESLSITNKCKDHQQPCIPVYCRDCKTPVCTVCVTKEHGRHNLTGIVDAANETQIDLQELLNDKDKVLEHAHSLSSRVDEVIKVCDLYKEGVIRIISNTTDTVIQDILNTKSELIEKVKTLSERYGRELHDTSNDTQSVIQVLNVFENCDHLCRMNDVEKALFKLQLQNVLKTKVENLQHQSGFPFSFSPHMLQSIVLGEIIDENESASNVYDKNKAEMTKCLESEKSVPTEDKSDRELYTKGDDSTQETHVYKYQNRCIRNIVPVDAWNAYVLVDTELCKMNFTTSEMTSTLLMESVVQISTTPSDTVLVIQSNSKTISHILSDGRIIDFCKSRHWQPTAVCSSSKAFAIIMMYQNHDVSKPQSHTLYVAEYDHNGVIVRNIYKDRDSYQYSFRYKFVCHSRFDEIVYLVSNSLNYFMNSSGVYISDANLKVKKTYKGSIGPDPKDCFHPTGLCIDDNNQILVAVPHDNAIHLLDQSGKYIRLLLSEKDGLKRPCSVFLDKRGKLWVGTENGDIMIQNYNRLSSNV